MEELSQPNHKSKQFEPLIWLFTMACKWSLSICLFLFVCVWGLGHKQAVRGVDRWTDLPPTPPTPSQAPPLPFWLSLKIKEQETKTRKQTKSGRYFWTPFSGIYSYEHKNCKLAKKPKNMFKYWRTKKNTTNPKNLLPPIQGALGPMPSVLLPLKWILFST